MMMNPANMGMLYPILNIHEFIYYLVASFIIIIQCDGLGS